MSHAGGSITKTLNPRIKSLPLNGSFEFSLVSERFSAIVFFYYSLPLKFLVTIPDYNENGPSRERGYLPAKYF
jgi:hypothetical protein